MHLRLDADAYHRQLLQCMLDEENQQAAKLKHKSSRRSVVGAPQGARPNRPRAPDQCRSLLGARPESRGRNAILKGWRATRPGSCVAPRGSVEGTLRAVQAQKPDGAAEGWLPPPPPPEGGDVQPAAPPALPPSSSSPAAPPNPTPRHHPPAPAPEGAPGGCPSPPVPSRSSAGRAVPSAAACLPHGAVQQSVDKAEH